jgi:uncharacterized caspase-like protein
MVDMRLAFSLCIAATLSALIAGPAWSEQRLALVIGNANYPDSGGPLGTTIRDVRSLADEFRRSGFEVDLKENLGKAEMQRAIETLVGKISSGATTLLFFSGYGLQAGRQTYLIPVNAQIWAEADVRRDGISLDDTVAEFHRKGAKVQIVIIDAARRNPYERRFRPVAAGLAPVDTPENTLALYSAAPGKLINEGSGSNGLFAVELMKELRVPNGSAEDIFNRVRIGVSRASNNEQIPWLSSSLVESFYFGSRPAVEANKATTPLIEANKGTTPRTPGGVRAMAEKHNLIGRFAWDCSKPVARNNLYFVHRMLDGDRLQREQMSSATNRDWVVIIDQIEETSANELAGRGMLTGRVAGRDIDNKPTFGIWRMEQNRFRQWDATVDGQKTIINGRFGPDGTEVPWINKCGS